MEKLSPQKEYLLKFLRDMKPHCASEWADRIKDDRTRFCELEPYMAQRGYKIDSNPCRGSVCGRSKCPLNKRQAVKLSQAETPTPQRSPIPAAALEINKQALAFFDSYPV